MIFWVLSPKILYLSLILTHLYHSIMNLWHIMLKKGASDLINIYVCNLHCCLHLDFGQFRGPQRQSLFNVLISSVSGFLRRSKLWQVSLTKSLRNVCQLVYAMIERQLDQPPKSFYCPNFFLHLVNITGKKLLIVPYFVHIEKFVYFEI